jgi:two-component system phosphate regulon sensor histidine kinase PhoR
LLGIQLDSCIGQAFPEVLQQRQQAGEEIGYNDKDIDNLLATLREKPEVITQHDLQRVVNGQAIYIEEVGLPVRDTAQAITGRLLVLRDVTKARLLEAQREDFTDMVVHDLRGPLGSIHNALDLALDNVGEPETREENRLLLQSSRQNASRLMRLVETLLDIAKMQSPDLALDREPVAVQALVESAQAALLSSIQQAELDFIVDVPPDLPYVYVDRDKILRVLINLLDNAVRYASAKGEIMISAKILAGGQWLELRVNDSGEGIPPNLRESIFDRFRRVPGKRPLRGHKGHGLGLSFSRQAVEKHGGTIQLVDDCKLSGACFALTLPVLQTPAD